MSEPEYSGVFEILRLSAASLLRTGPAGGSATGRSRSTRQSAPLSSARAGSPTNPCELFESRWWVLPEEGPANRLGRGLS
jgi:hypothetical protein